LGDEQRVRAHLEDDPAAANAAETCGVKPLAAAIKAGSQDIALMLLMPGPSRTPTPWKPP